MQHRILWNFRDPGRCRRAGVLSAILTVGSGCTPTIELSAPGLSEGGANTVIATVTPGIYKTKVPSLSHRGIDASGDRFTDDGVMSGRLPTYTKNLPDLTLGVYDVKAVMKYLTPVPAFPSGIVTETIRVYVGATEGCFDFVTGGLGGWTFDGVYNGSTTEQIDVGPPIGIQRVSLGWPDHPMDPESTPGVGSVRTMISNSGFPGSESTGIENWRFDLVSPNLTSNSAWQGISGVAFRVASLVVTPENTEPTTFAQAMIITQSADGTYQFNVELNSLQQPIFHPIPFSTEWYEIEAPVGVPADGTVVAIRLRIFGSPVNVNDLVVPIFVDGICAIQ